MAFDAKRSFKTRFCLNVPSGGRSAPDSKKDSILSVKPVGKSTNASVPISPSRNIDIPISPPDAIAKNVKEHRYAPAPAKTDCAVNRPAISAEKPYAPHNIEVSLLLIPRAKPSVSESKIPSLSPP